MQCKICNHEFDNVRLFTAHLRHVHKIPLRDYYNQYLKKSDDGYCKTCGRPTKFIGLADGYQSYCSKRCANTNKDKNYKARENLYKKYGVTNVMQLSSVKEKIKKTVKEKYGCSYIFQSDSIKKKIAKTNKDKYGVENVAHSKEIRDKITKTNNIKYGGNTPLQSPEVQEKLRQTNLKKYGVEYVTESHIVQEKIKNTVKEKYGYDHIFKIPEIKEKIKNTNYNKYGYEYATQSAVVKEKQKQTIMDKYGVDNIMYLENIKNKIKETNRKKYGYSCIFEDPVYIEKLKEYKVSKYGTVAPSWSYIFDGKIFDSSYELSYYIWLKDHNITFTYHPKIALEYEYNDRMHYYNPDFLVNNELYELKGLQFFENHDSTKRMINPFDRTLDNLFEAKHQCMIRNNIKIITDCDCYIDYVAQKYGKTYLKQFTKNNIDLIRNELSPTFPYYSYTDSELDRDFLSLNMPNQHSGMKIIRHFYKNIFDSNQYNHLSPSAAWNDKNIMRYVIANRLQYKGYCNDEIVRNGLSITKLAPKVSIFKPYLAKLLISNYLSDFDTIFDPFSGFGGRMLGTHASGKTYIGYDINKTTVDISTAVCKKFNIAAALNAKDIFLCNNEIHDCLFTCPPYGLKEIWVKNQVNKSCDEWIDECLARFKCKKYLFVVDNTDKYKDNIVECLKNQSHFNTNYEYVVLINNV